MHKLNQVATTAVVTILPALIGHLEMSSSKSHGKVSYVRKIHRKGLNVFLIKCGEWSDKHLGCLT